MRKDKAISQDDLAIDALLAATCRTGALDPDVSAKEAESLSEAVWPLARREQAAFAARSGDLVAALRRRMGAAERRERVGFVQVPRERTYAAAADQEPDAARSAGKLRRARKRMKEFLGE